MRLDVSVGFKYMPESLQKYALLPLKEWAF